VKQINLFERAAAGAGGDAGGGADPLDASNYETFAQRLRDSACRKCALHAGRTQIVVDRGTPTAPVVVIGEGPGKDEDQQGRAFIGRAGKSLDATMAEVGLDTNRDMLIINVVKCRPPGNRAPTKAEAAACLPYLRRQLALVAPKLVVLLGATALKHLAPGKQKIVMADEVGRIFTLPAWPGMHFIVLYHPAALLYNRSLEPAQQGFAGEIRDWLRDQGLCPPDSPQA
jgi:uracil-DNA glycosylase family 4